MKPTSFPGLDVQALLEAGMGAELHWFPEDVPVSRLASVMAGMANTRGGVVILGAAPRSGEVIGISRPEEVLDRIFQAGLYVDPPLVLPLPQLVAVGQAHVMVVMIPTGLPYVYNLDGRYFGREAAQTNPLPARRLRALMIERGMIQFESLIPPGASLADLDTDQVTAYRPISHDQAI